MIILQINRTPITRQRKERKGSFNLYFNDLSGWPGSYIHLAKSIFYFYRFPMDNTLTKTRYKCIGTGFLLNIFIYYQLHKTINIFSPHKNIVYSNNYLNGKHPQYTFCILHRFIRATKNC